MKNDRKIINNVSIGVILSQFWKGVRPIKGMFFSAYLIMLSTQIINVFVPIYYKRFFDLLTNTSSPNLAYPVLIHIILIVLGIHLLNWTLFRVAIFIWNPMQLSVMANLKMNAFDYTIDHSHTFFANNFGGSLVQKVGRFSRSFELLSDTLAFSLMPIIVAVIGSIWVTFFIAPVISVVIVVWVTFIVVFSVSFSTWKFKYDIESAEADSRTVGYLSDAITNNTAVSFFTGHKYESEGFKEVADVQVKKTLFSWRLEELMDATQALLMLIVEFFVFYYSIKYWRAGIFTVGTFVLAQTYIIGLSQQLWGLKGIIRNIYRGVADSKEMVDILVTKHEIQDAPDATKLNVNSGEIAFKDVSFDFGKGNEVLSDLNITIKPGEKVAMVGPSGAGKTTFVRLIMRLYNLSAGSISIDGQDISKVTQESLRGSISFVPQDPVLFHRTLMENIRYGRRDATDEDVKEAARLAHCDEFIDKLPLKYETFVGERGIKLSGGERQRVAIARAILKKAPILIFDEATSSLDSYSESLIQDALENLMKDATTIVIAHRLSTVKKMDRIISMQDGKIVEDGTHDELANKDSGLYKKLWDLQVSGFI